MKLDVYYVKHASFFGDVKLIPWTEVAILYTACGKYPQWMHDKLVWYAEMVLNDNITVDNLPIIVKDILESSDLQKIKRLDLKKISIDGVIGAMNAIPSVGGVVSSWLQLTKDSRQTYLELDFYRKLLALIYEIQDLQPKDIKCFMDDVEKNANDFSGNVITNLVNRTDNINKARVLANLIKSRVKGDISIHDFFRLSSVLERIPYVDLNRLEQYKKPYYDDSGDTELLYATGALKLDTIDADNENLYILSELGRKLLVFGMHHFLDVENKGGTNINGMITSNETITDSDIDQMFDDHSMYEFDRNRGK